MGTSAPAAKAEQTMVGRQIERAKTLERERSEKLAEIATNREFLRLLAKSGEMSDSEQDWLEDFYPEKEKGESRTEEEQQATRDAKEAARTGKTVAEIQKAREEREAKKAAKAK